jgi:serine/threonine-protein kinase
MSFLTNLRADRLIADIKASDGADEHRATLEKLVRLGPGAIPRVLDALASATKQETTGFIAVLTALLDHRTFPLVAAGLTAGNQRTVAGAAAALSSSRNYPAAQLFTLLDQPAMPKATIVGILAAQKSRVSARDVLQRAYNQDAAEKAAMFRIVADTADASLLPDLLSRVEGKDPIARTHIINILARFDRPEVASALQRQLKDPSKFVRQAVLNALAGFGANIDVGPLCEVLRDPDIETQQKAIAAVVRANHPDTMQHLIPVLRDEDENARRAAVEVLNEIGTPAHIKSLLQAIKDDDWWVRSRAADALAKIGGPRVIEAALELIRDQDEDVRRAAIEILNQTKDERAIGFLIEATRDNDWWVRERAVDALAEIGSPRALPTLLGLLSSSDDRSLPTIVRAIGKLGDPTTISRLLPLLASPSKEVRLEVISALARLVDDNSADVVRARLESFSSEAGDATVSHAAMRAVEDMDARFSTGVRDAQRGQQARMAEPSRTLLAESTTFDGMARQAAPAQRLDISALKPGDVLEGRYKYIQKIGKGAFGTVLLMEDTVVDERLVLKFLNPNVSQDEEMMKRFVHELRYSRKITHRNVIRIYDFLFIRGNYAISMEYFPSHTLGNEINDKPLPLGKAVRYAMDVATGMAVAHQSGIIHRDLKPANVLIDDTGLLKIVDFGVAAAQQQGDTQLTRTGYVIGSPKYMAPEQILGKKVDERADVYSLGVILYEMLTGEPPYHRGDHMAVMYQHVQGKAKPPIELNPDVPPGLSDIVSKAMSVDKARRFQTMDELRAALERYL